jgi:hypothetical protein
VIMIANEKNEQIKIENDTLFLQSNNQLFRYEKFASALNLDNFADRCSNIEQLNHALKIRGYPGIEQILNDTSLRLSCSQYYEGKDIVTIQGSSEHWMLEI